MRVFCKTAVKSYYTLLANIAVVYMYTFRLDLVWFMVFNATFNLIQLDRGGQFYWWRKPEYRRKTLP
jgi:hypothetical protein